MRNIVSPLDGFASPFGRLRGSTSPLALYAANGITPQLVADFKSGTYGKAGALSTFDGVLEHSRAGLATMVDSDGVLKWAPHNLVPNSQSFDLPTTSWSAISVGGGVPPIVTNNYAESPDGTVTAGRAILNLDGNDTTSDISSLRQVYENFVVGPEYTWGVWLKSTDGISEYDVGVILKSGVEVVATVTGDWQFFEISGLTSGTTHTPAVQLRGDQPEPHSLYADILVWGAHLYRSDLGGMAPVPLADRVAGSETYVPTAVRADGVELVESGTFDADFTGWISNEANPEDMTTTVSGGEGTVTNINAVFGFVSQVITTQIGKVYTFSIDLTASNEGNFLCRVGTAVGASNLLNFDGSGTLGTRKGTFTATTTETFVSFGNSSSTAGNFKTVDNISVQKTSVNPAVARYLPRENHHVWNGTAWVKEGYLHEPEAATNLNTYYFPDTTNWSVNNVKVTLASGESSPFGQDWVLLEEEVNNAFKSYATPSISFTSGTTYTMYSFIKKQSTADIIQLTFTSAAFGNAQYANFDLSDGSLGAVSGGTARIKAVGTDEYLVAFTATATATGAGICGYVLTNNDDAAGRVPVYVGDGASGFYVGPIQIAEGSTISSLIPTSGSQVTRAADILTLPIENIPYPAGGSLAVSFGYKALVTYADEDSTSTVQFLQWLADINNSIATNLDTVTAGSAIQDGGIRFQQIEGGVVDRSTSAAGTYSPGINVPVSIASRHGSTFINGAVDGTALTANTTPTAFPALSTTDLVIAPLGGPQVIQEFIMWGGETGDIGDAGIEETSA